MRTALRTTSRVAALAAATLLAGTALAGTASAAPAAPITPQGSPGDDHRWTDVEVVLTGKMPVEFGPAVLGNRHQLLLTTDNGEPYGALRSYYCPSGASISPTWASSRCTYRHTITLEDSGDSVGWVSSTGLSGTQKGLVQGYRSSGYNPFDANLTLKATEPVTDDGDGTFYSFWAPAKVTGTFQGLPLLPGSKQTAYLGGYGPV